MSEILGYSSYSHEKQKPFLQRASRTKSKIAEDAQKNKLYGSGLELILIFYNFEAVPNEFAGTNFLEKKFEVQRYNSKEKSLRVNVFVGYNEITNKSFEEQIEFYYYTTMKALKMVKEKFIKRKNIDINIDFDCLIQDIHQEYINNGFLFPI